MDFFEPADIAVYIHGRGIVLKEKSLAAFDAASGKIMAFGTEAQYMAENPPENIKIISPMHRGKIADYTVAVQMLRHFLVKAWGKKFLFKQPIAICVPKGITEVEKKAVEDALYQAGAKEIFIADVPLEKLLEAMPTAPKAWQKVKVFIDITKNEPERYVAEELFDIISYARQEGISDEKVAEMFETAIHREGKINF